MGDEVAAGAHVRQEDVAAVHAAHNILRAASCVWTGMEGRRLVRVSVCEQSSVLEGPRKEMLRKGPRKECVRFPVGTCTGRAEEH